MSISQYIGRVILWVIFLVKVWNFWEPIIHSWDIVFLPPPAGAAHSLLYHFCHCLPSNLFPWRHLKSPCCCCLPGFFSPYCSLHGWDHHHLFWICSFWSWVVFKLHSCCSILWFQKYFWCCQACWGQGILCQYLQRGDHGGLRRSVPFPVSICGPSLQLVGWHHWAWEVVLTDYELCSGLFSGTWSCMILVSCSW